MVKARLSSVLSKITVPYQILPAFDGTGIAIGYYEKVIGYGRKGFVVMVGDDDAMVLAPLPYKSLDLVDIHRIDLRKWFIQDVEWDIAKQNQVQFGQSCFTAGEFIDGRIIVTGKLGSMVYE